MGEDGRIDYIELPGGDLIATKRFYEQATVDAENAVLLDGKPVRTPARRLLAAPDAALAQAIADEWNAQTAMIDPATMPLTRLANAIIDGVAEAPQPVADEIARYLASDMVFYRAGEPASLVEWQARHWDPVLAFARAPGTLSSSHFSFKPLKYVASGKPVRARNRSWPPSRAYAATRSAVRVSCHTSALWSGAPVLRSQSTVVSR